MFAANAEQSILKLWQAREFEMLGATHERKGGNNLIVIKRIGDVRHGPTRKKISV